MVFDHLESISILIVWIIIIGCQLFEIVWRGKRFPHWLNISVTLLAVAYLIFRNRIVSHEWIFYHFDFDPNASLGKLFLCLEDMRVLDGFWVIGLICFLHEAGFYWRPENHSINKSLYSIEPFDTKSKKPIVDKLNRINRAVFFAEQISKIGGHTAFAIGIVGQWGTGKTHFVKLIERSLDRTELPKTKVIWFTTWQSSGTPITQAFFEKLRGELSGDVSLSG
jgi:hypothetical protein